MDVIDRKNAKIQNLKFYFTGKPCKYGHVSKKYTKSSQCVSCLESPKIQSARKNYAKNYGKSSARKETIANHYRKKRKLSPETYLFYHASSRAKKQNLPFNISIEDVRSVFPKDGLCPILRIPLEFSSKLTINTPSLDKIKPTKGYVKGNIIILSMKANMIKSNIDDPEVFRRLANLLE